MRLSFVQPTLAASIMRGGQVLAARDRLAADGRDQGWGHRLRTILMSWVGGGP